ncbi:hypothetical protein Ae201684P_000895 [Aphanomyces euteiches]|nr:hypothetical protein Ae201684P_000895 [Aphanomyces euteiches]
MGSLLGKNTAPPPSSGPTARQAANKQKAQNQVSSKDRVVLELKASRDRLKKYQTQLERESADLTEKAKKLLEKKQRDRAKLCLQLRKFKEQQIEQADAHLMNVLQMVDSVEWESQQLQIFEGLKAGNSILWRRPGKLKPELIRLIGNSLSVDDEDEILAELAAIEQLEAEQVALQLPIAPDHVEVEALPAETATPTKPKKEAKTPVLA